MDAREQRQVDPTLGQISELFEQIKAKRINQENLQAFLRNPDLYLKSDVPVPINAANLVPGDLEVIQEVEPSKFEIWRLEAVPFFGQDKDTNAEEEITTEVLRQRAIKLKANLGLADAQYILGHQAGIPNEFRKHYFVFLGAHLRVPENGLVVAFLYWHHSRWFLGFRPAGDSWTRNGRLLRIKPVKSTNKVRP
ncbi:MAG: hypothetical protein G01um101413_52 [Parcubacteria group bacterium Gr01-1014_13]|nr:MAG: hypothetical protein G01um101413_52 [Parcubacteria group bacterium Gr01-1014_13]